MRSNGLMIRLYFPFPTKFPSILSLSLSLSSAVWRLKIKLASASPFFSFKQETRGSKFLPQPSAHFR